MDLAPVVTRLKAECPALRQVMPALSGAVPTSYPSVYVLPLKEAAEPNTLAGTHLQHVTSRFGVELMLTQAADAAHGGPAGDALETQRQAIIAALRGWSPAPGLAPVDWESGELLSYEPGLAIWRDTFVTEFYLGA